MTPAISSRRGIRVIDRRHPLPNGTLRVSEIFSQHHIVAPPHLLPLQYWHEVTLCTKAGVDAIRLGLVPCHLKQDETLVEAPKLQIPMSHVESWDRWSNVRNLIPKNNLHSLTVETVSRLDAVKVMF